MSAHRARQGWRRGAERGLTTVEVLVSIAVFGICIPVLLAAMLFCHGAAKINAHKMTALTLAQKKIENLANLKFASLSTTANAYNENNVSLDSAGSLKGNVAAVVTADGGQRKKIAVVVSWIEHKRNLNMTLDTLVSNNIVTKP